MTGTAIGSLPSPRKIRRSIEEETEEVEGPGEPDDEGVRELGDDYEMFDGSQEAGSAWEG